MAGQLNEALAKADVFLGQHPRDPQMRFLKGLIFTEQNKSAEAIAIFAKLTEDFPDLPEPYNNLAVLYAAAGQYDKARMALDMAIRTNPTYATAHENLGDVYAKLASQAYDKALQLDSGNAGAQSKLTLVRTLPGNLAGNVNPKVPVAGSTGTEAKIATPSPVAAANTTPPQSMPPVAMAAAPAKATLVAPPAPVATPKAEARPESKAPSPSKPEEEILRIVKAWAKAWSAKDVKGYLSFYASDFITPKGESRKDWAEERRSRIEGKGRINVDISQPQITVDKNKATVKFRQSYTSDRLTANSKRTLLLEKASNRWVIKQERARD